MSARAHAEAESIRPFWDRITVQASPVDETQHESGLVLPLQHEGDDGIVRGIVLHVGELPHALFTVSELRSGMVVYYRSEKAFTVAGVTILGIRDVLAYEYEEND